MGSSWPKWKRLAAGLALCVAGALTSIVGVILMITLGSDDLVPGWVYGVLASGVVATLAGLAIAVGTLSSGRDRGR